MTTLVLLEEEVGSGADNAEAVELLPFVDEAVALVDVSLLRLPVPIEFPSLIAAPIRLPMTWAIEATAPGVEEVMVFLAELVLDPESSSWSDPDPEEEEERAEASHFGSSFPKSWFSCKGMMKRDVSECRRELWLKE